MRIIAGLLVCLTLAGIGEGLASDAGKDWGVERAYYHDPETHIRVCELTAGTNASDNLYFHFSNFTADNRFLLLVSSRSGSDQLYRIEVETGRIVQVTDDAAIGARTACPDPTNARRVYVLRGREVMAVDILDFALRKIGEIPQPCLGGLQQPTVSGDGHWLALGKQRDETTWEIGLLDTASGSYRTVLTQGFRIGHVQHSPTDSVVFYAWETGGFAPQRSWLVNTDGSGNRPFYTPTDPKVWLTPLKEWVTHEAWVQQTGDMTMIDDKLGVLLVKTNGQARLVREGNFWHGAARADGQRLVLDDARGRLWLVETATGNLRLLATGLRDQVPTVHSHPSFDRLGRYVQFHTGRTHETVALIDLNELTSENWTR